MSPIRVILHATDFSTCSEHAFRLACSLARDLRARLIILHVLERPAVAYTGLAMAPPAPPPVVDRQAVQAQLDQIQAPFPGLTVERRFEEGDPVTGILQTAGEVRSDLIVIGTHGRTGLGRLLMGSVAEMVVRSAKCPVLVAKMPIPEEQPASSEGAS